MQEEPFRKKGFSQEEHSLELFSQVEQFLEQDWQILLDFSAQLPFGQDSKQLFAWKKYSSPQDEQDNEEP